MFFLAIVSEENNFQGVFLGKKTISTRRRLTGLGWTDFDIHRVRFFTGSHVAGRSTPLIRYNRV